MENSKNKTSFFSFIIILFLCSFGFAQDTTTDETIKIDTLLLNIPVIVSDREGRSIGGLRQQDFYIMENNVKLPVDFFADNSAPMNVAILIDTSGSTTSLLKKIKNAARRFIKVLKPEDKVMIATFDSNTRVYSGFTSDRKELEKAVGKIKTGIASYMYDAMYMIMKKHFAPIRGRKAIIVLTDGMINGQIISEDILFKELTESDIMVYPLLFSIDDPEPIKSSNIKAINAKLLAFSKMNNLSILTGGKTFDSSESDFKTAFANIADELKKQYVLGFYPTLENIEKEFRVGIHIDPKTYKPGTIVIRTKRVIRFK